MPTFQRLHLAQFAALFAFCILAGTISGGLMNIFNGWLMFSEAFERPGGWFSWISKETYWNSINYGLRVGFWFGCIVAIFFTSFAFIISRGKSRFGFAARNVLKMVTMIFLFWLLGGFNGLIAAFLFPQFWDILLELSGSHAVRLKFLWVGGSTYGAYFGCLVGLIAGCFWFKRDWRRAQANLPTRDVFN